MTRRQFLRMLTRAGVAAPALFGQSGCAPALPNGASAAGLSLGYVTGEVTSDRTIVWLRAEPGSHVWLHYGKDRSWSHFSSIGPFAVDAGADHTVQFEMDTLEAATTYSISRRLGRNSRHMPAVLSPRRHRMITQMSRSASVVTLRRVTSRLQL